MKIIEVLDLSTGGLDNSQTFTCETPVQAVVNAAILEDSPSQLHNPSTRERYRKRAVWGRDSVSVGNFVAKR